ncbi:nuclear receptor coactivator 2 isoform X3 [Chrysoperla carnea]|nr:nuclear receptor coactivator 2 isoform X3 [Chrysoperla carnea]XP_044727113.1 nuclear receptor coactivator 2 isoform X3 [Chrysoperla carnea]
MSGAVASGVTKKRKKSDTKPQAQKNKCYNEKRRREQENHYIEDLADLISASFADMSSLSAVKPDKCAILQETVNQIRRLKEEERSRTHLEQSTSASPGALATNAVQQGEVSSSRPTDILANDFAPFLLEALEGFLIIVSKEGRIEQCSKNIEKYIKFTQEEVLHKDFFNIIHLGDTARFSAILKPPMSVGWNGEDSELSAPNRSFTCRFLIKPPDDREASLDERQQRVDKYEHMHVCSTEVQYPPKDENAETCLMCIARRIPHTEKAKVISAGGSAALEQFSTKLDTDGKIVSIDTSAVSATYTPYINKGLVGSIIQELCPPSEVSRINAHLKEVIQTGNPVTATFKLRFASALDKYINIQSKSKFFKSEVAEHIMSTHFIIGIGELDELESGAGESGQGSLASTPIGDPVMASVMNGATPASITSGVSTPSTSNTSLNNNSSTSVSSYNLFTTPEPEFDFPFPTSTWDMDLGWGEASSSSRPSSRHSATTTPVSTPTPQRPPSASPHHGGSNVQPCVPSPHHQQTFASQPQPSPAKSQHNFGAGSSGFSSFDETTIKIEDQSQSSSISTNKDLDESLNGSGRLRTLLSKKSTDSLQSTSPSLSNDKNMIRNKHCILEELLHQNDDDDESKHDIKMSPRSLTGGMSSGISSHQPNLEQPKVSSGNNQMLLRLLNEKTDNDDAEARAGFKKQSELLQQLLKDTDEDTKPSYSSSNDTQSASSQDDSILRRLGFTNSPSSPSRKRPNEDGNDDHQNKRLSDGTQVSSSGSINSGAGNNGAPGSNSNTSSKLCQKNKMLAQLLAKPSAATTPIPTLPERVITATPQEMSRVGGEIRKNFLYNATTSSTNTTNNNVVSGSGRGRGATPGGPGGGVTRTTTNAYINQILTNQNFNEANRVPTRNNAIDIHNQQYSIAGARSLQGIVSGGVQCVTDNNNMMWDSQNDKMLSDILDSVIDSVPEAYVNSNTALKSLIDELEALQNNNREVMMNETMAINAMAQSLRQQCDQNSVKSPSSPGQQLANNLPSGTPPAYSPSPQSVTTPGGFPPPPGYPQQQRTRFPVRNPQQYAMAAGGNLTQQQIILQRSKYNLQQEQKRRLLQQQQQQQLLIPSNATASELNSTGIANIDSLLNNTVAPNVSLQRSSNVPPDSQLSPGYNMPVTAAGGQRLQQQPYSPSYSQTSFPTVSGSGPGGGSRLSPLPSRSGGVFSNASSQQQPQQPQQQQVVWGTPGTQQSRLGLTQQQNPMLNAQLTGANYQNRSFASVQRGGAGGQMNPVQRSGSVGGGMVGSPGSASGGGNSRQSPFQNTDSYQTSGNGGPGNHSPTTVSAPSYNNYQQQQLQHRLQRTISAPPPTATTHLPGGLGSPRHHYPHPNPHHVQSPSHPHNMGPPYPHSGQQGYDSVQYCYDQSSLQLAYNGADRGRAPPSQGGGTTNNNMTSTSEFVRQELRAVVGARTNQQGGAGGGSNNGGGVNQQQSQNQRGVTQQQTQQNTIQLPGGQQVSAADLETLGLAYEMPPTGASDSPKLWGTMGSNDIGSMSPQASATLSSSSRTIMEETTRAGDQNSSLLQKLLSE